MPFASVGTNVSLSASLPRLCLFGQSDNLKFSAIFFRSTIEKVINHVQFMTATIVGWKQLLVIPEIRYLINT
jgi:hypothetical protein